MKTFVIVFMTIFCTQTIYGFVSCPENLLLANVLNDFTGHYENAETAATEICKAYSYEEVICAVELIQSSKLTTESNAMLVQTGSQICQQNGPRIMACVNGKSFNANELSNEIANCYR